MANVYLPKWLALVQLRPARKAFRAQLFDSELQEVHVRGAKPRSRLSNGQFIVHLSTQFRMAFGTSPWIDPFTEKWENSASTCDLRKTTCMGYPSILSGFQQCHEAFL